MLLLNIWLVVWFPPPLYETRQMQWQERKPEGCVPLITVCQTAYKESYTAVRCEAISAFTLFDPYLFMLWEICADRNPS